MEYAPLLLIALTLLLLFRVTARARSQQRELAALQSGLSVGDEVMTTSGLHATVAALEGDVVTLETAPGQRSRWARQAIGRVVTAPVVEGQEPSDTVDRLTLGHDQQ